MQVDTQIVINSTPEKVRDVILDFQKYTEWNPFLSSFKIYTEGATTALPGTQLEIKMKLIGNNESTMYPIVLENSENALRWKGKLLFDFMFVGIHSFEYIAIEVDGQAKTKLIQSEEFSGFFSYFFGWSGLLDKTKNRFEELNKALKKQIEQDN